MTQETETAVGKSKEKQKSPPHGTNINTSGGTTSSSIGGDARGKPPPKNPTKSMTKAERRALQEKQRAAKAAAKGQQQQTKDKVTKGGESPFSSKTTTPATPSSVVTGTTGVILGGTPGGGTTSQSTNLLESGSRLYSHLEPFVKQENKAPIPINQEAIHPAIIQLGLKYAEGGISGSNARALALLTALKEVIIDHQTPENKDFNRDLDSKLKPMIDYLKTCRPMSISMGNALKNLKVKIHNLDPSLSESEAKEELLDEIERFIEMRISPYAMIQIVDLGVKRIQDGDIIMTYAHSNVIEKIFIKAKEDGKKFSVIVVDCRPKHEGREMVKKLASAGIKCTLCLINAVSYMMKGVSKVMLGAFTLFSNGTLMSRSGTASLAMTAHAYNVSVLVCCETYKFSEKSQLNSITRNELSDPDELAKIDRSNMPSLLTDWRQKNGLSLLHLMYDVTPMEYVDMVITELGLIPPTSVPVILREYSKELLM